MHAEEAMGGEQRTGYAAAEMSQLSVCLSVLLLKITQTESICFTSCLSLQDVSESNVHISVKVRRKVVRPWAKVKLI